MAKTKTKKRKLRLSPAERARRRRQAIKNFGKKTKSIKRNTAKKSVMARRRRRTTTTRRRRKSSSGVLGGLLTTKNLAIAGGIAFSGLLGGFVRKILGGKVTLGVASILGSLAIIFLIKNPLAKSFALGTLLFSAASLMKGMVGNNIFLNGSGAAAAATNGQVVF